MSEFVSGIAAFECLHSSPPLSDSFMKKPVDQLKPLNYNTITLTSHPHGLRRKLILLQSYTASVRRHIIQLRKVGIQSS